MTQPLLHGFTSDNDVQQCVHFLQAFSKLYIKEIPRFTNDATQALSPT
jgi:hypothetical protein